MDTKNGTLTAYKKKASEMVEKARLSALEEDIPYEKTRDRIKALLEINPSSIHFFKFLAARERSSLVTDVNQLISYMRKEIGPEVSRSSVLDALFALTECGVGALEGETESGKRTRERFHWIYWIFPHFSNDKKSKLMGMDMMPIYRLSKNRNIYRKVKSQIALTGAGRHYQKIDLVSEGSSEGIATLGGDLKPLSDYSTDELREELKRRKWHVTLTTIPPNEGGSS
jgi:hypothetical protein